MKCILLLRDDNMMKKCQIFTPRNVVIKMLDIVGYNDGLFGKKVIENACGDGNILSVIVERYIIDGIKRGFNLEKIKSGLQDDIYGAEIDKLHYKNCIQKLNEIAKKYGINGVKWNVFNVDTLKMDLGIKFDYVIGNPPYMNYRDLDIKTRNFLKENYKLCKNGKFDYCYAFIEHSLNTLNEFGKMSYLVPGSIFKNLFAQDLRDYILPYLQQIHDYQSIKLFNVITSSAIVVCEKGKNSSKIDYFNIDKGISYEIEKKYLTGKWTFAPIKKNKNGKTIRFGDYFKASNSVVTLLNEAFVLKQNSWTEKEGLIKVGSFLIEKDLLKIAASPRSLSANKKEMIIFPYYYENGHLCRFSEQEFEEKFPFGVIYLRSFIRKLQNRTADKGVKWFEYGRTQALSHLKQKKLLVSKIITKKMKVYQLTEDVIPYSGIYIVKKSNLSLEFAKEILESELFLEYVNNIGINSNGDSLRITVRDINNFEFPLNEVR